MIQKKCMYSIYLIKIFTLKIIQFFIKISTGVDPTKEEIFFVDNATTNSIHREIYIQKSHQEIRIYFNKSCDTMQ